ncbi:hypothetical protein BJ165DRAFT_318787 [Panaeolus papilionaceus]|nr:hypothetical protein BJ165DRAFT_318787 [Panaeolus papilionaceus]
MTSLSSGPSYHHCIQMPDASASHPNFNAYAYTDEYAGYDDDAQDYAPSQTSRSPVIPPFSDQRFPPADSMLFGGGSVDSSSDSNQSSDFPQTPSPRRSKRGLVPPTHMYQYSTYGTAGIIDQRGAAHAQQENEPPRWQTAPTPEYRHLELSGPYDESPQSYQYDDGFDFEKTGPPPTPRHTALSLCESHNRVHVPLDRNTYRDSRFLSPSQGRRQYQTPQPSGRAMPSQLPSPSPSPCSRSTPLYGRSQISQETYSSRKRHS